MTDKLEPCRAMMDGKFCGGKPWTDCDDGFVLCDDPGCPGVVRVLDHDEWNTLQLDRLNSARWTEMCGRGLVSKVDADAIDAALGVGKGGR